MCACSNGLYFKINCKCQQKTQQNNVRARQVNLDQTYKKFSLTLEEELRKQHQSFQQERDYLKKQIFQLTSTINKLEIRNKRDQQSQKQLRRLNSQLLQKLRNQTSNVVKEVSIIEKIVQKPIYFENDDLVQQLRRLRQKYQQSLVNLHKVSIQKQAINQALNSLKDEVQYSKKEIARLKKTIGQLQLQDAQKQKILVKLRQQNQYLKTNKQTVIETVHHFPQFSSKRQRLSDTKIETVYIQKPVQKIVFVQVQKIVKQFVQPQRAVINRVIQCKPSKDCSCDDRLPNSQSILEKYQYEQQVLTQTIREYESNIGKYKEQRQRLAQIIERKDNELNRLEYRLKLMGSTNARQQRNSEVQVTVHCRKNEAEVPSRDEKVKKK